MEFENILIDKSKELYPDSEELRKVFIKGGAFINKFIFDYIQERRKIVRTMNEPFYTGAMNAYDGLVSKLNCMNLGSSD